MSTATQLAGRLAAASGMPSSVTLVLTERCNYQCVHCYQEHREADELSTAEVERILREVADAGVMFLTLMGGEVFVRRDADDILRAAKALGFAIRLKTTGHFIHDRRADFLATLAPIHVELSVYSASAHLHERVTRQPGSWQRTLDAARRLIARQVPVQLNAPVTEETAATIAELARLAEELGARWSFDPKIHTVHDGDREPLALRMTSQSLRTFYSEKESGDFLAQTYAKVDVDRDPRPLHLTPCMVGKNAVTITPEGKVWPCNFLPIEAGDLRRQRFVDIWKGSALLDDLRQATWATLAECNTCELRAFCSRCHGMAMIEHGELHGPSFEACRHAVAVRDELRGRGIVPAGHTALPPTWDRVDPDGQHHRRAAGSARRPAGLRVIA